MKFVTATVIASVLLATASRAAEPAPSTLILAHFMPWFEAGPIAKGWGWHWTMNAIDPERIKDGQREIASVLRPRIGPYDSGDPNVIEYQLLLMKVAGIDGVIVDWYGLAEFRDYPILHRNTAKLIERIDRLGMKVVICYEDQAITALEREGKLAAADRVAHAKREIDWLGRNWFASKSYVRRNGRPVLLSFGRTGLTDREWSRCLTELASPVAYFSQHRKRDGADGAFDWPVPGEGVAAARRFNRTFEKSTPIPVVFPRFVDFYEQAKVHPSYGRIEDDGGATFRTTLGEALALRPFLVQVATWNDWGEGTVVEPSVEYGDRDLREIRDARRKQLDPSFPVDDRAFRLPERLLGLRRSRRGDGAELDSIARTIASFRFADAEADLTRLETK